jgi:hypothetical protein
VGDLILKGKSEQLAAVEPITDDDGMGIDVPAYHEAFNAMRRGDGHAIDAFRTIVEKNPEDRLSAFHLQRLECGETGTIIDLGVK